MRETTKENEMRKTYAQLIFDLYDFPGGYTPFRANSIAYAFGKLTDAEKQRVRIEECADEKTGVRYGNAQCRRGKAHKIGGGGRNRNSRVKAYQLWLVWN